MKSSVLEFLKKTGNAPVTQENVVAEDLLERLTKRTALQAEELTEWAEAVEEGDWVEILDAYVDRKYLLLQDELDLEAAGFDIKLAQAKVCENNLQKCFRSIEDFQWKFGNSMAAINYNDSGDARWYCAKNAEGKVLKYPNFPKVDLKDCVPSYINAISEEDEMFKELHSAILSILEKYSK